MKLLISALVFFALSSCSKTTSNPANPPEPPPPPAPGVARIFKVQGTKILDSLGNEFIAKGVNVNGPYWPWPRPTEPDVPLITDVWKCNAVRLNCWREFKIYNSNNTDLDAIIKAFTDKKVVVMIEQHNFTGKYPNAGELTDLATYWAGVANKYKNNEYVWFNIMNEPGSGETAPADWLNSHEQVIKAIRNTGAPNIIVMDEHGFGQANGYANDAGSAALTYGPALTAKYSNLLFSLHLYANWIYGKARLEAYTNAVHAKNLALIYGEYGTAIDYSSEVASSVFRVGMAKGIGRFAWAWAGDDNHDLTTKANGGGFEINNTSGSKPSNLSFAGNLVWMDNHGLLTANSPELTPPPVLFYNGDFEIENAGNGAKLETGWINFGTAYSEGTPLHVKSGSYSVRIAEGQPGGCGQPIYLEPGGTFELSAWGKNSIAGAQTSNVLIKGKVNGSETTFANLDFTSDVFELKNTVFTIPSGVSDVLLIIYKNGAQPTFWCDAITVKKL
jgi:hypothetical protein